MQQPQHIILRAPNWLGDHIMALDTYRGIRKRFPDSHLCLFVPENLKGLISKRIVDEEWGFKKEQLRSPELLIQLRKRQFDLSISLTASWSSALLFYRAQIPNQVGFSESGSGILLTSSMAWKGVKSGLHKSELYLQILSLVGHASILNEKEKKEEQVRIEKKDFWVIAPGASIPLREWPYFPELIFEIKKRYPHQNIKVVGTHSELVWKSRLARWKLEGVEDHIGKTSLPELEQICKEAQMVIANDSGVAHLSGTHCKTPTLVIFGPGNPHYIAPRGPYVFSVRATGIKCSPCEKPYCKGGFGYQTCLKEISIGSVVDNIEKALSL